MWGCCTGQRRAPERPIPALLFAYYLGPRDNCGEFFILFLTDVRIGCIINTLEYSGQVAGVPEC